MSNSIIQSSYERAKLDFERATFSAFVPRFAAFDSASLNDALNAPPSSGVTSSGIGGLLSKKNMRNFIIQGERLNIFLYILPPAVRAQRLSAEAGASAPDGCDADVFQHLKVTVQPKLKERFFHPNESSASLPSSYASFPAAIFQKSPFSSHDSLQNFSRPNYTERAKEREPPSADAKGQEASADAKGQGEAAEAEEEAPKQQSETSPDPSPNPTTIEQETNPLLDTNFNSHTPSSTSTSSTSSTSSASNISNCFPQRTSTLLRPERALANSGLLYRVEVPVSFGLQEANCNVSFFITVEPVSSLMTPFGVRASCFPPSLLRPLSLEEEIASLHPEAGLLRGDPLLKKTKLSMALLQPLDISVHTSQSFGKQLVTVQLENTFQRDQIVVHDLNLQLAETFFISLKPSTTLITQNMNNNLNNNNNNNNNNLNMNYNISITTTAPASPQLSRVLSRSAEHPYRPTSPSVTGSADLEAMSEPAGASGLLGSLGQLMLGEEGLPIGEVTPVQLETLFLFSTQKPPLPLVLLPGDQFHFVVTLDPLPTYNLAVGHGFFKSNMLVTWATPAAFDLLNCRRDVYWANPFHGNHYLLHVYSQKQQARPVETPFVVDFLISNMSEQAAQLALVFDTAALHSQPVVPLQPHTHLGVVPPLSSVSLQVPFVGLEPGVHEITAIKLHEPLTGNYYALIHPIVFLIDDPI